MESLMQTVTAEEAVKIVKSGDCVYLHQGCSEPEALVEALVRRAGALRDVEIVHMATMGIAPYTEPQYENSFRHNGLFLAANVRRAVQEGRADYTPIFLSEIEALIESGAMTFDVALLQCAPPDRHGYMSLGPAVDITHTVIRHSRHVVVQINDRVPRTHGDSFIHTSSVHTFVEASRPPAEYRAVKPAELHRRIARYIANLVPDGATLQTGIGGIPEAVLYELRSHKDLGIHSEMIPDGVADLMEAGVITGARKTLHPRKAVAGFLLGTRRIFDFAHDNPAFELHTTAYVNDPFRIAQHDRMVAINSAIEVDLSGQVCSDSIGSLPYSGIGGQVDFIRGAARSKGGVPIIALPSTAKDGRVSRIVPALKPQAGVVTSRGDVHYVVTEYGVAYLHGKSLRQRAEALIAIARPDFRAELEAALRHPAPLAQAV
jgi:acyl-CoA hydrolase